MRQIILALFFTHLLTGCASNFSNAGGMDDDFRNQIPNAGSNSLSSY
ncbi:MAG: hypothetical protein NT054_03470 [Burkholderiales bacterium]|nr:hypothetical protein [Burkholderiales bacterium]